jgi:hypothetical protein
MIYKESSGAANYLAGSGKFKAAASAYFSTAFGRVEKAM